MRDGPNSLLVSDLEVYKAVYGSKVFEKGVFYSAVAVAAEPHAFAAQTTEQHRKARRHLAVAVSTPSCRNLSGRSFAVDGLSSA